MNDETPSGVDALEAFTEVLENVTLSLYATNKQTNMKEVATQVLSTLNQFGWQLYPVEGAKVRSAKAIEEAREYLARSKSEHVRTGAQSSMAYALQGILGILIEQQENSWDAPCDCFAGMPKIDLAKEDDDMPDQGLWGGKGARG